MSVQDALARQRTLNRETADAWDLFASHRAEVTRLVGGAASGLRLGVLGAGNGNDLDLEQLVPRCPEVTLVDIDVDALNRMVARQTPEVRSVLRTRAPVDLCCLETIVNASAELDPLALAGPIARAIGVADFDVVASTCVLSQLIDQVRQRLELDPSRCLAAIQRLRRGHLALMLRLLRPGGRGLLVSDLVSSDTAPELLTGVSHWPEVMVKLVAAQNFFTGLNPFIIESSLKQDPMLAPLVGRVALHSPWVWRISAARAYLVFAVTFQRKS